MLRLFAVVSFLCVVNLLHSQTVPANVSKLIKAYPQTIEGYKNGYIILKNGDSILYTQSYDKTHDQLLEGNDLGDIFAYDYIKGTAKPLGKNHDPGRIRNDKLLKKMYGNTQTEVAANLTTIVWCPKLVNTKVKITKINGVDKQLQKISDDLDEHPELKDYLQCAGTFNWRNISGTNRLSSHSFGTAIDIAVKHADYWQWTCRCKYEDTNLKYINRIPQAIVDVFEKHGFIWGGKWYHYDTMHFEYRPELLN